MAKICPKCNQTNNLERDTYCYADGAKLVDRAACECGRLIHPIDRFCPNCGKPIVADAVRADQVPA